MEVDQALRGIAGRRAALDAEELPWILEAKQLGIHARFGHATLRAYLEKALGYSRRAATARLHVAEAVAALPITAAALADGRLSFSAVRELVRIVTPETEPEWVETLAGRTVREAERLLSGKKPGDLPSASVDAEPRARVMRLSVRPETYELFCRARQALERELGQRLGDDAAIAALSHSILAGTTRQVFASTKDVDVAAAPIEVHPPELAALGATPDGSRSTRPDVQRALGEHAVGGVAAPGASGLGSAPDPFSRGVDGASPGDDRASLGDDTVVEDRSLRGAGSRRVSRTARAKRERGRSRGDGGRRQRVEAELRQLGWDRVTSRRAAVRALTHVGSAASLDELVGEAARVAGSIAKVLPATTSSRARSRRSRQGELPTKRRAHGARASRARMTPPTRGRSPRRGPPRA